jgi:small subunit ribosomal protein S18
MARDRRSKGSQAAERRGRVTKKKVSVLTSENIQWVDYKDVNLLRRFMSERAKIRARRVTGNSAQQQRAVARAIRIAREMALLPYSVRQVTQRSKGRGRDRDRDMLREPPPTPPEGAAPPPPEGAGEEEVTGAGEPPAETTAGEDAAVSAAEAGAPESDEAPPSP